MASDPNNSSSRHVAGVTREVEQLGKLFVAAWLCNQDERIESYASQVSDALQLEAHHVLIPLEVYLRASHGESLDIGEYHRRFPDYNLQVERAFRPESDGDLTQTSRGESHGEGPSERGLADESEPGNSTDLHVAAKLDVVPTRIGRYQVDAVLGTGGFGVVCLARDTELDRKVALKFARTSRFRTRKEMDDLIAEARTAAQLTHHSIVAVYDVLLEGDVVAIIQQYIEGQDLASEMSQGSMAFERVADVTARISKAISFAHAKGFIHRDLKPANILLNLGGDPHIADFGLAIHESFQRRRRGEKSGTPRYMSPEQVRGESHRIDGRSDIWSIGVIMYEMLTKQRPFSGETRAELFDEIKNRDPKPPRQINTSIPVELERICLRCLGKSVSARYSNAADVSEDLRSWLQSQSFPSQSLDSSTSGEWEVIPRGLRSFDADDADFFPGLLPGPFNRNGLPESIRFWKGRIEASDQDPLQIGLLYGPSGCGKSSFIKAGLIPHLAPFVQAVRVEATAADTEVRLIKALRSRYHDIPTELTLPEVFHSLREGLWTGSSDRILIVIDQFEQWLHNRSAYPHTELVEALRHCDGQRLQCLLTVRDDFWLATSRFLKALEVDLVEGKNAALVDLFDRPHAEKVLRRYGRGYGRLEEKLTKQQEDFVAAAVQELSEEDRVICVRLSLFAEMFKDKPWTPAALKKVGGISGVGVAFLEETFSSRAARPEYRLHEQAARNILAALLPNSSVDIRGNMRSRNDLLYESGYANRPNAFDDVIRILDNDLRLITPTDPEGIRSNLETDPASSKDYYQLTHDYLVGPLRIWLNQKQRESMRGRARLRLDERHATWSRTQENRFLPAFGEYVNVRMLTRSSSWSAGERQMLGRADRVYGIRLACVAGILLAAGLLGRFWLNNMRATTIANRFVEAETIDVPSVIRDMDRAGFRSAVSRRLNQFETSDPRQQLNIDLALAHQNDHRERLWERLVSAESEANSQETVAIARGLKPSSDQVDQLWRTVTEPGKVAGDLALLRAATALSIWFPDDSRWQDVNRRLAETVVGQGAFYADRWTQAMPGIREVLLRGMIEHLADWRFDPWSDGNGASPLVTQTTATDPQVAISLIKEHHRDWPGMLDHLRVQIEQQGIRKGTLNDDSDDNAVQRWERTSQTQANLAAIAVTIGAVEPALPLLTFGKNEMTRWLLIEQLHRFQVNPQVLIAALQQSAMSGEVRSALWLALAPFVSDSIDDSDPLLVALREDFLDQPNALVHSSVEWLLRKMNQPLGSEIKARASRVSDTGDYGQRQWRVDPVTGGTFLRVKAPHDFVMSAQRRASIDYDFEVAATETTWQQFLKFEPGYRVKMQDTLKAQNGDDARPFDPADGGQRAATNINWYLAAGYCNWLSEQSGISEDQWCYETLPENEGKVPGFESWGENESVRRPLLRLKDNYRELSGFRLPLESEWDWLALPYGIELRQTATLARLLGGYEWYGENNQRNFGVRTTRQKMPGRFGTFDLYGNVHEFCCDFYATDRSDDQTKIRLERNADYIAPDQFLTKHGESEFFLDTRLSKGLSVIRRSLWDSRTQTSPLDVNQYFGFRVVRVLPGN